MRFTEEGQRGTLRLTVAGVKTYEGEIHRRSQAGTVRLSLAGVRTYKSEVHRGDSGGNC